jgi:hypothetical protein
MMMEIEQDHVSDESGSKPESRFHDPLEPRRHINTILQAMGMNIVLLCKSDSSQEPKAKS